MLLQGYKPSLEPSMILKAHRANRLTDIRTRCKIHVQKGCVLIGCLDETGKLDYGQVYIRITKNRKEQKYSEQPFFCNDDGKTAVIVGKVAISKNPCLHPGDVRVLEAIYDPGLDARGLIDCVVFPQRGERYVILKLKDDNLKLWSSISLSMAVMHPVSLLNQNIGLWHCYPYSVNFQLCNWQLTI